MTDLAELRRAASCCRGCPLYQDATATVFGEGRPGAELFLVGEQPGDREDREGAPFVGPAGRVLDQALERAGIDRDAVYVTNAVKHFKWEPRGGRRLHKKPTKAEVKACQPWLEAEIAAVAPRLICGLGATATDALMGPGLRVTEQRGKVLERPGGGPGVVLTVHPSSILRGPPEEREVSLAHLVSDLSVAARFLTTS